MGIELFGTGASVIIAISLMQKNIRWLRSINALGAVALAVYGALIGAWPVLALNTFIFFIDLWYLIKLRNRDEAFDYLTIEGLRSPYVRKFLDFHIEDIHQIIPEFDPADSEKVGGCLILRDVRPVALILYRRLDQETGEILLDYAVEQYRDYANARYFIEYVLDRIDLQGIQWLYATGSTRMHRRYLEIMGFQLHPDEGQPNRFRRAV